MSVRFWVAVKTYSADALWAGSTVSIAFSNFVQNSEYSGNFGIRYDPLICANFSPSRNGGL